MNKLNKNLLLNSGFLRKQSFSLSYSKSIPQHWEKQHQSIYYYKCHLFCIYVQYLEVVLCRVGKDH